MNYKGVNKTAHMADGSVLILLERKSGTSLATIIDAADWENVRRHQWHADKKGNSFYVKAHARRIDGARTTVFFAPAPASKR